ncbi:MAG: response regulator [Alphaproteobacteria bacterium]|nr:response regulator [Alphaproteobacteria bacterium]
MNLNLERISILVVEDIMPMRDLLVSMLKTMGVGQVYFASDGQSGFNTFCNKNPDIVMTDWHMPELNGIELAQKIRKSEKPLNFTVPIMMMSGYCSPARISDSRDNGITEFIVKPFSAMDISTRMAYMIKNPRDFIITKEYAGPDRRRKKAEGFDETKSKRTENSDKLINRIPADTTLQEKTGIGKVSETAVSNSQKVLDDNQINFKPIVSGFIKQLEDALKIARSGNLTDKTVKMELTTPIMQIKANAKIFHYALVGDLANIALTFIEGLATMDENALVIVQAYTITLKKILSFDIKESDSREGEAFKNELQKACDRHMRLRNKMLKDNMIKELEIKEKS